MSKSETRRFIHGHCCECGIDTPVWRVVERFGIQKPLRFIIGASANPAYHLACDACVLNVMYKAESEGFTVARQMFIACETCKGTGVHHGKPTTQRITSKYLGISDADYYPPRCKTCLGFGEKCEQLTDLLSDSETLPKTEESLPKVV